MSTVALPHARVSARSPRDCLRLLYQTHTRSLTLTSRAEGGERLTRRATGQRGSSQNGGRAEGSECGGGDGWWPARTVPRRVAHLSRRFRRRFRFSARWRRREAHRVRPARPCWPRAAAAVATELVELMLPRARRQRRAASRTLPWANLAHEPSNGLRHGASSGSELG